MTSPVLAAAPGDSLQTVHEKLIERDISSLAVVDGDRLVGVVSRTDLLRVGRRDAGAAHDADLLTFPNKTASELMSPKPQTVLVTTSIADAAARLVEHEIHRVFVTDGDAVVGVLSARDVMGAIRDNRDERPLSAFMSSPVVTVQADEPISFATDRLAKSHVTGLVVIDDQAWPIGVFTQVEALESKDHPRDTAVEEVVSWEMIHLEHDRKMYRAAAQAAALGARRVIAVSDRKIVGILTGLDFARAASNA